MNAQFDTQRRFTAAGVITAAVLIMILAMEVSTLRPSEVRRTDVAAASSPVEVVQAHHQRPIKKS